MTRNPSAALWTLFLTLALCGCTPKPKTADGTSPDSRAEETIASAPEATTASATPAAPPKPAPLEKIRIVAWNLEWFPGHKPNPTPDAETSQMEQASAALAELNPDVLLLEEIRDWESAEKLCATVPGLKVHVVSRFQPRPQNQVVASRFPADSTWSASWQASPSNPPRGYSFAALELPNHCFLLAYALHLKSNLGELGVNIAEREEGVKQLLQHSQEMVALYSKRMPCAIVFGGDMNTSIDDPQFDREQSLRAMIKAGFHWTHQDVPFAERTTIPAKNGFADNCFDHIFTAGLGKPRAVVKSYPGVSDHNPVIIDVELSQADFKPEPNYAAGIKSLEQPAPAPQPPTAATPATAPMPATETLLASDDAKIRASVGKTVAVRGKVQTVGTPRTGGIYFINFQGNPRGQFMGIVRKDNYDAITAALGGGELKNALAGKSVELRGKVELYKDTPQIVITAPNQIVLVK